MAGALRFLLHDLDTIYASRTALRVTEAAILTTLNTLIGGYRDDAGHRRWLALQGSVGRLRSSLMIVFAGLLAVTRWNGVFLIYLVALPIFLAMTVYLYEPESDTTGRKMLSIDQASPRKTFPWAAIARTGGVTLFAAILCYVFIINGGLAFREVGVISSVELGRITAVPSLFIVAGAGVFWLTERTGAKAQLATFLALLGVGLATIGLAPDWPGMVAGLVIQ